jgi:hypothetical protein
LGLSQIPRLFAHTRLTFLLQSEGSYCEWGTSDNTIVIAGDVSSPMLPCPPGNYCPKGTYIPIPVPRGYFAPGEGNSAATMCLPGLYTPYEVRVAFPKSSLPVLPIVRP